VYDKSFGYHTYDKQRAVERKDVYDLASITKIMATTLATMKLYEDGQLDIFQPISDYLEGPIDSSNKADITIIEALTHHAGLLPWIPFYQRTLDTLEDESVVPGSSLYSRERSIDFSVQVANRLFLRNDFADTIRRWIIESDLLENKHYRYSDLGLYLVRDVIESVAGEGLDTYVDRQFYQPMDLTRIGFRPLNRIPADQIIPSEVDRYFRMQELRGYVHDMGAAMLGGVSGHAGLFSNAGDLAALMQMLLNQGIYGNHRYLDRRTIYTFTTRYQRSTRRGIGFDMKELDQKKPQNLSELAPSSTFGHFGFTGTCVFADPENQLIYVFISNRTHPGMENTKLAKENYRTRIQSQVYEALQ
jgi:CubicO group peptidase (beta-lactamase class C family)